MVRFGCWCVTVLSLFIHFACASVQIQPLIPRAMITVSVPAPPPDAVEEGLPEDATPLVLLPLPTLPLFVPRTPSQDLAHAFPELFEWMSVSDESLFPFIYPEMLLFECLYFIHGERNGTTRLMDKVMEAAYRGLDPVTFDRRCTAPPYLRPPALDERLVEQVIPDA